MWNIEKIISKGKYDYCTIKEEHPNATKNGYILLHRIIMENFLGRLLNTNEIVHHKDENGKNNDIKNLEVMDKVTHSKMHSSTGLTIIVLKCPNCQRIFERRKGQTHLSKPNMSKTFCSRKCNGQFGKNVQLHGLTTEMNRAISENIVREYKSSHDNSEQTIDNGMRRDYTPDTCNGNDIVQPTSV